MTSRQIGYHLGQSTGAPERSLLNLSPRLCLGEEKWKSTDRIPVYSQHLGYVKI